MKLLADRRAEANDTAGKEARAFFVAVISVGAVITATAIGSGVGMLITILERLPG